MQFFVSVIFKIRSSFSFMYSLNEDLDSARFLDFGTFVSVCKYLLFLYSLNGDNNRKTKLLLFVSNFFVSVRLQNFISFNLRNWHVSRYFNVSVRFR